MPHKLEIKCDVRVSVHLQPLIDDAKRAVDRLRDAGLIDAEDIERIAERLDARHGMLFQILR